MADAPTTAPPNWLRRQCPDCGMFVTGPVKDGESVARHRCDSQTTGEQRSLVSTFMSELKIAAHKPVTRLEALIVIASVLIVGHFL